MRVLENGEAALKRTIAYNGKDFFAYNEPTVKAVETFTTNVISFLLGEETKVSKIEFYFVMTLVYDFLLKNKSKNC